MDPAPDTDKRLIDLEIKSSYTEDLLDQLNQVIVRQQQDIDMLVRELRLLKQLARERGLDAPRQTNDELPPHY